MALNRNRWKWILAALALASAAAIEGWALKRQSERVCRTAVDLAFHANALRVWLTEADADPFLGEGAMRGPVNGVIAEYRSRSRWILSEFSGRFLPEQARQAFLALNSVTVGNLPLLNALQKIAELKPILHCEGQGPASEEAGLARQVEAGNDFWRDQKAHAELAKIEFARDRVIFCKGDELLRGLQRVAEVSAGRCQGNNLSPNRLAACAEGKTGPIANEINDLLQQKEFNLRKMMQKWPEIVVRGMRCF